MARIALIAGYLLGACAVTALAGCDLFTSPQDRVSRAEQLIASGKYSEALVELNVALEKVPKDTRARLALARVSLQLSNPDAATRALDAAAENGADAAQIAELRANVLLQQARHEALLEATRQTPIPQPARELLRLRGLVALNRIPEAVDLAHSLPRNADTAGPIAVALAESYARLGNPAGALVLLDAAVREYPDSAEAWLARGRLQQLDGKVRDAEQSLRTALDTGGGELTLVQQLNAAAALCQLQLARNGIAAARETWQRGVQLAPESAIAALLGARLTLAEGKPAEAAAALQELLARHRDLDEARLVMVSAMLAGGTLEQALQQVTSLAQKNPRATGLKIASDVLRRLDTLNPQAPEYWISSAAVHVSLGQPYMARAALQRALELAPDSSVPQFTLAQLELQHGNPAEALRIATAMAAREPDNNVPLALLGEAYRGQQQYPQAAQALEKLWARAPNAATALALARVRTEGKLGGAAAALGAWTDSNPGDLKMRGAYADALRQEGENAKAIHEFEALLAAQPDSVPALNNLAWLYYLEKDARAIPTARRAWQLATGVPSVADTYGWLLVESGAIQEGLNVLESAYHDGGLANPEVRYHYAAALARADQSARAAPLLAQLLEETPDFPTRAAAQELAQSLR